METAEHQHADAITIDPRRVPDPGEPIPVVAWPTVSLFVAASALFIASTWLALAGSLPYAVAIVINGVASYMFFTVLHDACHRSASQRDWVNTWLGRLSAPMLSPGSSYSMFRFIHMQHHRFTNHDIDSDPDAYASNGPAWTWPLRWATLDLSYLRFYLPRLAGRPLGEKREFEISVAALAAVVAVAVVLTSAADVLLLYLLPTRLAVTFLGFAFDWLPHHGLTARPEDDRYKTTRNRVGMEWLMNPVMLYQNYHLIHHLHPLIPFYRYLTAWRRNEEHYLLHETPLTTITGRELSPEEYRLRSGRG